MARSLFSCPTADREHFTAARVHGVHGKCRFIWYAEPIDEHDDDGPSTSRTPRESRAPLTGRTSQGVALSLSFAAALFPLRLRLFVVGRSESLIRGTPLFTPVRSSSLPFRTALILNYLIGAWDLNARGNSPARAVLYHDHVLRGSARSDVGGSVRAFDCPPRSEESDKNRRHWRSLNGVFSEGRRSF